MKKKVNKKKIILLIILICLLILQIKAFTDSTANKLIEITLNVEDNNSVLKNSSTIIQATNEEASGYSISLPEFINEKKVSKYYITEKQVENEKEISKEVEKNPGDKIYLTNEETLKKQVELKAKYDSINIENTSFYNTRINATIENKNIQLNAYVEDGTFAIIENKTKEDVTKIDNYLYEYGFNSAYSINLEKENGEKALTYGNITISIESEDLGKDKNKEYKILHITESEETQEEAKIEEIEKIELSKNKIQFETKSLSTFVILEKENLSNIESSNIDKEVPVEQTVNNNNNNELIMTMQERTTTKLTWDGSVAESFSWGSGTESEPYLIADGKDLAYLARQVNNGNTYEGQYFQIADDIDLGARSWTPIGTSQNSFRGILDGAGHTISNATITVSNLPDKTYESYGIFASIGGGNTKTIIRNLELSNINVEITASGDTGTVNDGIFSGGVEQDAEGLHIGTLVGSMYKNSNLLNVIVKSSVIQDTNVINIIDSPFQFSVGGIVGYASNGYNNNNNPGNGSGYIIDNCYSQTQISLDSTADEGTAGSIFNRVEYNGHGQYHTGGIIGTIRGQAIWPTNSLYSGSIKANGFIGPIFGALINNTRYTDYDTYATLWYGNDAGNLTANNLYYTNYTANGTTFNGSITQGNTGQRISNRNTEIGYVQGLNKGIYTSDMNSILNIFNNNVNTSNKYLSWIYENGTFSFKERLTTSMNENPEDTYNIEITDPYEIGEYTLRWYKNGNEDSSIKGTVYTPQENRQEDENMLVLTFDGSYYAVTKFIVYKTGVYITFDINENNDSVVANLEIVGLKSVSKSDYTYQWYIVNNMTGENEILEGKTGLTLTGLEEGNEYKLVATNEKDSKWTVENSFIYGTRTVIYVKYNGGNDRNNGLTPETPVKTLSTAYGKLDAQGTRSTNIIVLMDRYQSNNDYTNKQSNTYNKPVTITGKYNGISYENSGLYIYSEYSWISGTTYKYLNADTTFQYLNWYGQGNELYLLAQGYSVTIGEGVTMVNYASANRNQGLLGGNAPAVHLFAGWLQYNESKLPRNNSKIVIQSGTFGRLVGGGTPGTSSGQGQTTSHDFMGSSKEDTFNVEITVDIKTSTKGNYDYDINLLTGGSAAGNNYSNVIQNIKNGSVGRLIGGSIGDSATRPRNWNYPENTFLGTATINVTGGTIRELYGGCLGRNMSAVNSDGSIDNGYTGNTCDSYFYGKVTINIDGGEITDNIYGAGAGGVTGYSPNSSDPYKSYGEEFDTSVNINITGGTIKKDVYGGGYGFTEYLNANVTASDGGSLYGNSYINISGSPVIEGDIYAAGCGYNYSSRPNLAKMEGTSNIDITGTPKISGEIFGAGAGIARIWRNGKTNRKL